MITLNKEKLDTFLGDYSGESIKEKLQAFCQKQSTGDPATSPNFEKIQVASSNLIVWIHGETPALKEKLAGMEWKPL
jgi:hypothetical protein